MARVIKMYGYEVIVTKNGYSVTFDTGETYTYDLFADVCAAILSTLD